MVDDIKYIELIERMVTEIPVFTPLWAKLFQRFLSAEESTKVKASWDRMCNIRELPVRDSFIWFECFYEGSQACGLAFEREGVSGDAIKVYQAALVTDTMFETIWSLLCRQYGVMEQADAAEIARSLAQALKLQ